MERPEASCALDALRNIYAKNVAVTDRESNQYGGAAVTLTRSGTSLAWIVFIAYPGHRPRLSFNAWGGFKGDTVSYLEINGFEIVGNNDNVTIEYANANRGTGATCGTGIEFDGRGETSHPHHLRILNNSISKCGGGGISIIQCDYVTVENNQVFENAWYSNYANGGISTYQNWRFDDSTGYKMIIRGNVCCNNRSLVTWDATGALSDGNGIIIDDLKNTQNGSALGAYTGRTLVANNLCFNNGGSGIHSYMSEHVDIVNNTAYANGQVVDYACIFASSSNDVNLLNNIMYASAGRRAVSTYANSNALFDYNIYFGGTAPSAVGPHDLVADPLFLSASADPAEANFRLDALSPAVNSGTDGLAVTVDLDGNPRPTGTGVDRGCYEYVPAVAGRGMPSARRLGLARQKSTPGAWLNCLGRTLPNGAVRTGTTPRVPGVRAAPCWNVLVPRWLW